MTKARASQSNRVEEWRRARGLSMQELAEMVGTTAPTINKIEKGQMRLSADWMFRMAEALQIAPADVLAHSDRPAATKGLAENAVEWTPPTGHVLQPLDHVAYIRMTNRDLGQHPLKIGPDKVLVFDLNAVHWHEIETGRIVYVSKFDKASGLSTGRLIGQFVAPNKLISNAAERNWMIAVDDPSLPYECVLRGALRAVLSDAG